jgi:Tol biopolymer transport system component
VTTYAPYTSGDLLIADLGGDEGREAPVRPFIQSTALECCGSFSPDGRLVAYASDETGRMEVYVRRFPGGEGVTRVSADGGFAPRWPPRGDTINPRRRRAS